MPSGGVLCVERAHRDGVVSFGDLRLGPRLDRVSALRRGDFPGERRGDELLRMRPRRLRDRSRRDKLIGLSGLPLGGLCRGARLDELRAVPCWLHRGSGRGVGVHELPFRFLPERDGRRLLRELWSRHCERGDGGGQLRGVRELRRGYLPGA